MVCQRSSFQELLSLKVADSTLGQAQAQLEAAKAQTAMGYVGIGTLVVASVGLVKLERDIKSLREEQVKRDEAYKKEQAQQNMTAAAKLNATVLLVSRETPPVAG